MLQTVLLNSPKEFITLQNSSNRDEICTIEKKGICRLDGTFNSFNLVKYADYESVEQELELIATEFPFLDITATVYDKCISEDSKEPVFSFKMVS